MSARGSRVTVRESKKEAIATSMALDFVSLASCDEGMVQECDAGHTQLEALKRKRPHLENDLLHMLPMTIKGAESKCASSTGSLEEKKKRMKPPQPRNPFDGRESRSGRPYPRWTRSGKRDLAQMGDEKLLCDESSLSSGSFTRPRRPPSSTGGSSSFVWPDRPGSALSLGHDSQRAEGLSRMGSSHNMLESPSSFADRAAALEGRSTPPGAPTAFEAHTLLVKCPAPKPLRQGAARTPFAHHPAQF